MALVALGLLLLLDGRHDAPRGAAGTDDVLVGDGQQVALLDRELNVKPRNLLHRLHHFVVPLSLLGDLGHVPARAALFGTQKRQ